MRSTPSEMASELSEAFLSTGSSLEPKEPIMSEPVERVDIPCGGSALAAFRGWAEQVAASQGKTLAPAWYEDSPEDRPGLYRKSPAVQQAEGETDPPGGAP
jgi:hypothetical protein